MATYLPNVQDFIPEIEAFTPDYKFLNDVLKVRQDRYSSNFKSINDLYGKVLYSNLTAEDNINKRNQYVEQIAPRLKQVAGLDLSLAENVQTAKGVFAPFYEDKDILKDLVFTSTAQNQIKLANSYRDSDDRATREKYWSPGIKAIQYQIEDFKNAKPEERLAMSNPRFVPDADLIELGLAALKDSEMSISNVQFSPDGKWIISTKNGQQLLSQPVMNADGTMSYRNPAADFVAETLLDDPRVQEAYNVEAYVNMRDFLKQNEANFGSREEAQKAWASQVLGDTQDQLILENALINTELSNAEISADEWDAYKKQYGIVPGSSQEDAYEKAMYQKELLFKAKQNKTQRAVSNANPANNINALLNTAYKAYGSQRINRDIEAAAQAYANIDAEVKYDPNPYYKAQFENELKMQLEAFKKSLEQAALQTPTENKINIPSLTTTTDERFMEKREEVDVDDLTEDQTKFGTEGVIFNQFQDLQNFVNDYNTSKLKTIEQAFQHSPGSFINSNDTGTSFIINPDAEDLATLRQQFPNANISAPGILSDGNREIPFRQELKFNDAALQTYMINNPNVLNSIYGDVAEKWNTAANNYPRLLDDVQGYNDVKKLQENNNQASVLDEAGGTLSDQFIAVNQILNTTNGDWNRFSQEYRIPFISETGTILPREQFINLYVKTAQERGDHMVTTRVSRGAGMDAKFPVPGLDPTPTTSFDLNQATEAANEIYDSQLNIMNLELEAVGDGRGGQYAVNLPNLFSGRGDYQGIGSFDYMQGNLINGSYNKYGVMGEKDKIILNASANTLALSDAEVSFYFGDYRASDFVVPEESNIQAKNLHRKILQEINAPKTKTDDESKGAVPRNTLKFNFAYAPIAEMGDKTAYVFTIDPDYAKSLTQSSEGKGAGIKDSKFLETFSYTILVNKDSDVNSFGDGYITTPEQIMINKGEEIVGSNPLSGRYVIYKDSNGNVKARITYYVYDDMNNITEESVTRDVVDSSGQMAFGQALTSYRNQLDNLFNQKAIEISSKLKTNPNAEK